MGRMENRQNGLLASHQECLKVQLYKELQRRDCRPRSSRMGLEHDVMQSASERLRSARLQAT